HRPRTGFTLVAQGNEQIAPEAGVDGHFRGRAHAGGVHAFLRVEHLQIFAVLEDLEGCTFRFVVGSTQVLGALKVEVIAPQIHRLASVEQHALLGAVDAGQGGAQQDDGKAQVGNLRAQVAHSQGAQARQHGRLVGNLHADVLDNAQNEI